MFDVSTREYEKKRRRGHREIKAVLSKLLRNKRSSHDVTPMAWNNDVVIPSIVTGSKPPQLFLRTASID